MLLNRYACQQWQYQVQCIGRSCGRKTSGVSQIPMPQPCASERPLPQSRHLCGRETTWSHNHIPPPHISCMRTFLGLDYAGGSKVFSRQVVGRVC